MLKKIKYQVIIGILSLYVCDFPVFADCQPIKLFPGDGIAEDKFGVSVAVDGNFAVIGAYQNDSNGIDSGAAYIYERLGRNWLLRQKITASDATAGAQFGWSVAIDADTIVIGSHRTNNNTGAAYIFTHSGDVWSQQAKLTAPDAYRGDCFGYSVAISGNTVVIGAYKDDNSKGSVYIFIRTGSIWIFEQKLTASDAIAGDYFGNSVAIDTNSVLIGSYYRSPFGISQAGSVYYYTRTADIWSQQAIFTAADPCTGDHFGCSVALDANIAVVGAYECDTNGIENTGAAYVFSKGLTGWTQQQKLVDTNAPCAGEDFGRSIAVEGNAVFVGCPYNRIDSNQTGSVFEFVKTSQYWTQKQVFSANDSNNGDNFGFSTAISGRNLIIGAHFNSEKGTNSGAVYLFNSASTDFDDDCNVDFADFALLADLWDQNNPDRDIAPPPSGDGIMDIYDLAVFCSDWLTGK